MKRTPITYRAGAGGWTLTAGAGDDATVFDIKAMTPAERGRFFAQLRDILKERYAK